MKIGVVTISFNQARFLPQAIESVRVEGRHELAYVIVDPGSTDGSRGVIAQYQDRFHATILEKDAGPADGLNKGIAALPADIEVFGYINSDDYFEPGALSFACDYFAAHPDVDVLLGAGRIADEHGRTQCRKRISTVFTPRRCLLGNTLAIQQATFLRARVIRAIPFNRQSRTSWDSELIIDAMLAGFKIACVHVVLGSFRIYAGSITDGFIQANPQWLERWHTDHARVAAKIVRAGTRPPNRFVGGLERLAYRANPVRRYREFFCRGPEVGEGAAAA